jgi:hypothetical protein
MQMVVQRELRLLSRRWNTYWLRVCAAGVAIFVMAQSSLIVNTGDDLFLTMFILGLLLCAMDGVRRAADSIANENADGTLGLLLLTPLSGENLLFGKYASVMIATLPLALAVTPIFAVAFLLGGVSASQFVRAILALLHAQSLVVGTAVMISARSRSAGWAMVKAIAFLALAAAIAGSFVPARIVQPLNPMAALAGVVGRVSWPAFLCSICLWQLFIFCLLKQTGRILARSWQECQEKEIRLSDPRDRVPYIPPMGFEPVKPPSAAPLGPIRATWFKGNPMEWLALRGVNFTGSRFLIVAAAVCGLFAALTPIGMFYLGLFTVGLIIFLCVTSARSFAFARQTNSLELIATTPLGWNGMIEGHFAALRRIFLWPGVISILAFGFCGLKDQAPKPLVVYWMMGGTLLFFATPWIGMWMGLKCKTPLRAVMSTIALVVLTPRLGCIFADLPYFAVMLIVGQRQVRKFFGYVRPLISFPR